MNTICQHTMYAVAVLTLVAAPLRHATAQDASLAKPVAIVSFASPNKLMGDVTYLTRAAGAEDVGQLVVVMAGAAIQGLDKTKPAGVVITMDGPQPKPLGFVGVKDLNMVFQAFRGQFGEPEDVGDGVYAVAQDQQQPAFVKQQGEWAFIAQSKEALAQLPADPAPLLGTLPTQYNLAVRVFVQNIPQDLRQMAINQISFGMQRSLEQQAQGDPDQQQAVEHLSQNMVRQVTEVFNNANEVTFGWAVDSQAQSTHLDFSVTAIAGSKLAQQLDQLQDTKSQYAGFLAPDGAVTLNVSSKTAPEEIEQSVAMLNNLRKQAMDAVDQDANLPDEQSRKTVKDVLGSIFDVVQATVESGKMDAGALLVLNPEQLGFAAGGFVADGKALDAAFRKLVNIARNDQEFPQVTMDADKHGDVVFHSLSVPVDDEEARRVIGEKLNVIVATGPTSAYVAFGDNAASLLKSVIDKSAADASKTLPPMQINIALTPIVKFASSIQPNPIIDALETTLEKAQGKDRVLITAKSIQHGISYQVKVEEGVLLLIGEAAKNANGGGAPPNFDDGGF